MAGPAEGAHASGHDDDGTLALRLVSMGIIAVVSLCGCALPAAIHHRHYHGSSKGAASPSPTTTIFSILKVLPSQSVLHNERLVTPHDCFFPRPPTVFRRRHYLGRRVRTLCVECDMPSPVPFNNPPNWPTKTRIHTKAWCTCYRTRTR